MSELDDLIAEARREGSPDAWPLGLHYKPLLLRLADALEATGVVTDEMTDAAIRSFHEASFGSPDDGFLTENRLASMRGPWRAALTAAIKARNPVS